MLCSRDAVDAVMTDHITDEDGDLYTARKKIYPKAVTGFFRSMKWRIMVVTLAIYYLTPWIRWYRGEGQPDQAVLIDLANRRFYFFFIEIWPREFYFVAGLLVMAGIGLFLVTSVVGRAWCGYFCTLKSGSTRSLGQQQKSASGSANMRSGW
jgi:hypothetical protein